MACAAAGRCDLYSIVSHSTYDASRATPMIEQKCACSVPSSPFLIDVGTAAAVSRPDIVRWLQTRPTWQVFGYDPNPGNCKSIEPVLAKFGSRSRFLCAAVSDEEAVLDLRMDGVEGSRLLAHNLTWDRASPQIIRVPAVTLDRQVPEGRHVFMLKMDVQGNELQVLRGAEELLRQRRVSWIVSEFDVFSLRAASHKGHPSSASALLAFLHKHDFSCVNLRMRTWRRAWSYSCPDLRDPSTVNRTCAFSDLLCGHKDVARPIIRWQNDIEREFCGQPGFTHVLC